MRTSSFHQLTLLLDLFSQRKGHPRSIYDRKSPFLAKLGRDLRGAAVGGDWVEASLEVVVAGDCCKVRSLASSHTTLCICVDRFGLELRIHTFANQVQCLGTHLRHP